MTKTTISCPNCGTKIDINEVLAKDLEKSLQQEYQKRWQEQKKALEEKEKEILEQKKDLDFLVEKKLKEEAKKQKKILEEKIKSEQEERFKLLEEELEQKSKELIELNKLKALTQKLKREKDEAIQIAKLQAQKELNQVLNEEKQKIKNLIYQEMELKIKQKDEQLEQLQKRLEEAKRVSEQTSQQLQGEAQELLIEEWLKENFIYDNIIEIKKGAFGADCIQIVNEKDMQNCGKICYESKNTKNWSDEWVQKLKNDMIREKADIGVLVTKAFPKELKRMGFYKGIWVCSLEEFKGSAALLRYSLISLSKALKTQENKTDKMNLLYSYLTSSEFSMQFNAIVDGFIKMQEELDKEKRSIQASWKRRQKTIDQVIANTSEIYGSLQAIASNLLPPINALELKDE